MAQDWRNDFNTSNSQKCCRTKDDPLKKINFNVLSDLVSTDYLHSKQAQRERGHQKEIWSNEARETRESEVQNMHHLFLKSQKRQKQTENGWSEELPNLRCVCRGGFCGVIYPLIVSENKPPQDDVKDQNLREILVRSWESADQPQKPTNSEREITHRNLNH